MRFRGESGGVPARERRIVFINRFYAPDLSATAQILTDVASHLASADFAVTVFSSRANYAGDSTFCKNETLERVQVRRLWSTRFGRKSNIGRAFDFLTFYISVTVSLLFFLSKHDTVVVKTDPPMVSVPVGMVSRIKRATMINWLQDVYPEVASELGIVSSRNIIIRILKWLRNGSLIRARLNIAIGNKMAAYLAKCGVAADKIIVIENFVDDFAIRPVGDHSPLLRSKWGLRQDDFVVGYSGNLGRAHELETILNAAKILRDESRFKFLFVGGGYLLQKLEQEVKQLSLDNVVLRPYQPRSGLNESLALPNLHLATLNPRLEGFIVPSKAYGIAAAGRPLLMIGAPDGEIGKAVREFAFGACFPPGAAVEVVEYIRNLSTDPELCAVLGENARSYTDQKCSKNQILDRWTKLLHTLGTD